MKSRWRMNEVVLGTGTLVGGNKEVVWGGRR
jgi:hypothetical protein